MIVATLKYLNALINNRRKDLLNNAVSAVYYYKVKIQLVIITVVIITVNISIK